MKKAVLIVPFIIASVTICSAQPYWSLNLNTGTVYNVPLPIVIKQSGYPDINLTAHFRSEALILPVYWNLRLSRWQNGKSWELEAIHHKLFLHNTTPEVQKFNISHGFNMVTVNRGFDRDGFQLRAGAGVVLTHPESTVRGKDFGISTDRSLKGYYVSGPVVDLAISKPYYLSYRFCINAEAKTTLAYTLVKIAEGHANVYNIAFHLVLGLGYDLRKQSTRESE